MKKIVGFILVLAAIAGATLPLWGSCNLQSDVCSQWCTVRYYDSDIKAAACRAECVADRLGCLAKEGGLFGK